MPQKKIDPLINERAQKWLDGSYDENTKKEVLRLLKEDPVALSDAFFKDLSFGTGGMRGIMGVGTNRMNLYTVRKATQGLASYLKKSIKKTHPSAFIGYDVRHHSKEFAEESARVFAGNGIQVFLSADICPTPLVSFGCRHFGCQTAVMITASHNPPQYNGYKVYWEDGAQVVHPHDTGIMNEVHNVQEEIFLAPLNSPLICKVGEELNQTYLAHVKKLQLHPKLSSNLKILYTPLHGTGLHLVPQALQSWGYQNIDLVLSQSTPDGNFPNAPSPNPEEEASLALGIKQLAQEKGDVLIATDPDADRVGVVCQGPYQFTGNQVACLLLEHICKSMQLPPNATFVKSIVTTELFRKIAEKHKGLCVDVLTGFKYIGEKIAAWEKTPNRHRYIFGAEESCGYLFGTFVRDKDAISSACLIAETAALAKQEHKTLLDRLYAIYEEYGVHRELLVNLKLPDSEEGMKQIDAIMHNLRQNPPPSIEGGKVVLIEDFLPGSSTFPPSDMVRIFLEDQTKIVIRPSGTEPKIKIYLEVVGQQRAGHVKSQIQACDQRLQTIKKIFLNTIIGPMT